MCLDMCSVSLSMTIHPNRSFQTGPGKWRRLPPMPTPRCGCCAVGTQKSVVVLAGQLANGTVLDKE